MFIYDGLEVAYRFFARRLQRSKTVQFFRSCVLKRVSVPVLNTEAAVWDNESSVLTCVFARSYELVVSQIVVSSWPRWQGKFHTPLSLPLLAYHICLQEACCIRFDHFSHAPEILF